MGNGEDGGRRIGWEVSERIVNAAFRVHRTLGPGLLESVYEHCLAKELAASGARVWTQVQLPVVYRGETIDAVYRIDLVVDETVIVEVKATESLQPIHSAQLLTYLKLSGYRVGLLINFNVPVIREGLKRLVL